MAFAEAAQEYIKARESGVYESCVKNLLLIMNFRFMYRDYT